VNGSEPEERNHMEIAVIERFLSRRFPRRVRLNSRSGAVPRELNRVNIALCVPSSRCFECSHACSTQDCFFCQPASSVRANAEAASTYYSILPSPDLLTSCVVPH
jgi:hypothetical protein